MRQSILFTKTRKKDGKEEVSLNARLLLRAGFVNKEMAGVYSFLPLGLRVIRKIEDVIRREMKEGLGAQEVLMPALHPIRNYEITGRDKIDILFHTALSKGGNLVLGQSHEEIVVPLLKQFVFSYRDLPKGVFQIQPKFRNEERAKSGILRGREFIMKDLYSFHADEEDFNSYYEKAKISYKNIFQKLGIGDRTYPTFASGGTFSKYSDEFQSLTPAGEDTIYLCRKCNIAINEEIIEESSNCPQCNAEKSELSVEKSIEVGNIFPLSTGFSTPFQMTYKDKKGEDKPIFMGCYGIGVSRVMGAVVEIMADDYGMVWPEEIAPFRVHLLSLGGAEAEGVYNKLIAMGAEVLFDDREKAAGEKFADSDLMGIPYRVVVSEKTMKENTIEIKKRNEKEARIIKIDEIMNYAEKNFK